MAPKALRPIEVTSDVIRLLTAWKSLADSERQHFLREVEAAAVFWDCSVDDPEAAFPRFMRATLETPPEKLPAPSVRAIDTKLVRQFANAMVEQIETACEAPANARPRLAHAFAKALAAALASEDREERCGAQLALSAVIVQLVQIAR